MATILTNHGKTHEVLVGDLPVFGATESSIAHLKPSTEQEAKVMLPAGAKALNESVEVVPLTDPDN